MTNLPERALPNASARRDGDERDPAARTTGLPSDIALELAHGLIQHIADRCDIDLLFIKGLVSNHHALRPPRISADVDVWVKPPARDALISALEDHGWRLRPESFAHQSFVDHSVTMMHDRWPCDIDVHIRFPGLFAEDSFEKLFARRVSMRVLNVRVAAADLAGSFVIALAHALRQRYLEQSARELSYLRSHWKECLDHSTRQEIIALTADLGASEPLRPFFDEVGVALARQQTAPRLLAEWELKTRELNRTSQWFAMIAGQPWRARPRIVIRALFPSRADLEIDHPEAAGSWRAATLTRIRRVSRATRAIASGWRSWRALLEVAPRPEPGGRKATRTPVATQRPATDPLLPTESPQLEVHGGAEGSLSASIPDDVLVARASDRLFVLRAASGSCSSPMCLEGSTVAIWEEIARGSSDIVGDVAARYRIARDEVAEDVREVLARLKHCGLIIWGEG